MFLSSLPDILLSDFARAVNSSFLVSFTIVKFPFEIFSARRTIAVILLLVIYIINTVLNKPTITVSVRNIKEKVCAYFSEVSNISVWCFLLLYSILSNRVNFSEMASFIFFPTCLFKEVLKRLL
ncbi:hypothetical protein D3C85_1025370 [compost metagenome]